MQTAPNPTGAKAGQSPTGQGNPARQPWMARCCHILGATPRAWQFAAIIVSFVALLAVLSEQVAVASGLAVAVMTIAALIDVETRRLPNVVVGLSAIVLLVGLPLESFLGGHRAHPGAVVGATLAYAGPLLIMHLISPRSMGFGDVKAAAVLGAALGATDWQLSIVALTLAAGVTATIGLVRNAKSVPFGPGLVAAASCTLAVGPAVLNNDNTFSHAQLRVLGSTGQEAGAAT